MRLIYKCLHCLQMVAREIDDVLCDAKHIALNAAYNPDPNNPLAGHIRTYGPHPCEPGILGVAQLVAVRDD